MLKLLLLLVITQLEIGEFEYNVFKKMPCCIISVDQSQSDHFILVLSILFFFRVPYIR